MAENNNKRRLLGLEKNSFAPVVASLCAALGSALALTFAVRNVSGVGKEAGYYAAGEDVLFVVSAAFGVFAALCFIAAVVMPSFMPKLRVLLPFVGAPYAFSFLLAMIGGIIRSGQYAGVIEILYFIFVLVSGGGFAVTVTGFLPRKKSLIALFGLAGIGLLCAFIPVWTGGVEIMTALTRYIPSVVILAAFAALALGVETKESGLEKQ